MTSSRTAMSVYIAAGLGLRHLQTASSGVEGNVVSLLQAWVRNGLLRTSTGNTLVTPPAGVPGELRYGNFLE
jgi:hypothetical protein